MQIPYGNTSIPWAHSLEGAEVLQSRLHELTPSKSEDGLVLEAMAHPVGSPRLSDLAVGKKTCTVIISDHTRPVPSRHIIPFMLDELRQGNPDIVITLLVATGFHRPSSRDELIRKLGREIVEREHIQIHDCRDPKSNREIGRLPSGARLVLDCAAADTELLVAEGFIEPHFFAGFSGGRKSVLPGVCDQVTVLGNHCAQFIASDRARTGVLEGNPLHIDMVDAARQAKLAYIVNVVIDEKKRVVAAFAGDFLEAHREGCRFLSGLCGVKPVYPGDIVVTSNGGAPLDQNVYQSVKGLSAAEAAAAPGAVLIICAQCADGAGGESFYHALKYCTSPEALLEAALKTPMEETKPDQWEYQILARILCKHHVLFVADPSAKPLIEDMKMEYCPSLESALDQAYHRKGSDAHLVVIPNGISVIVEPA